MQTNGIERGAEPSQFTRPPQQRVKLHSLYLDMDGLLVNFVKQACAAHNFNPDLLTAGQWAMERDMGISAAAFWGRCAGHLFWESMEWMPDGREILSLVEGFVENSGLRLHILTSPSDDCGSFSGKYAWLQKHAPHLRRRLTLSCNKGELGHPGALLIDDSDDNCRKWRGYFNRVGGEAILVPRWWNSESLLAHKDNSGSLLWLSRRLENYRTPSP